MEASLTKSFGLSLTDDPAEIPTEELRTLLSHHGVLLFKNRRMTKLSMSHVMSKLGKIQDWEEQQAPLSHTDKENHSMINLYNEDFLGKSRMAWHMDQTYLTSPYLPVRSLYAPFEPAPGNITSFMDLKAYSNYLNQEYPELMNEQAKYFIDSNLNLFNY
jgi:alpha-ketoglutarate-dependent taurine dioxygenase